MDEKRTTETTGATGATGATELMQLYGVGDLATALKVPHGYVTPFLNRGIFCPTHQWRGFRLFTHERIEQIVREHGNHIRATSLSTASTLVTTAVATSDSQGEQYEA